MAGRVLREQWAQTSLLCAVVANCNPFRKGEPVAADAFNPYRESSHSGEAPEVPIDALQVFVPRPG